MSQKQILIHYGELSTKGRNKKMFINKLAEHIRYRTQDLERIKIVPEYDFMHLIWQEAPYQTVIERIETVPGISSQSIEWTRIWTQSKLKHWPCLKK